MKAIKSKFWKMNNLLNLNKDFNLKKKKLIYVDFQRQNVFEPFSKQCQIVFMVQIYCQGKKS